MSSSNSNRRLVLRVALATICGIVLLCVSTLILPACSQDPSRVDAKKTVGGEAVAKAAIPMTISGVVVPEKYFFRDEDKTVYLIQDGQLRSDPARDDAETRDIQKYSELHLTGTNDCDWWRVEFEDTSWYIDRNVITDDSSVIDLMRRDERLQSLKERIKAGDVSDVIVLGDSRMVGMDEDVSSAATFIAKVSMGYKWMMDTAIPQAEAKGGSPNAYVFNFGINDMYNVDRYISALNAFASRHPDDLVYYMSVNPVDEARAAAYGYSDKNSSVVSFNDKMRRSLSDNIIYIDSYSWMMTNGFSASDGIHYSASTDKALYKFMIEHLV